MRTSSLPRRLGGTMLAAAGLLSLACGRAGTEIVVQGSPTFLPVGRPAIAAYRPGHPPSAVLLTAGSAEGMRALLAGTCDIAAVARELTADESRRAQAAGADLRQFRLGYAAAVPVVHPDNRVTDLSPGQLRGIWSGTIRRWSEVGGPDLPIHVVTRAAGSALSDLWDEAVMGSVEPRADATRVAAGTPGEPDPLLDAVRGDPTAIGFAPLGAGPGVRALAVGGIAASEETLRKGRFPLARALYLVLDGRTATDTVQGFVDFLLGPEGQRLVRRTGILPA